MRFSDIVRGARAVRRVAVHLPGGGVLHCGVRPLHPEVEEPLVVDEASRRASDAGGEPTPGDAVFDGWLHAVTLARTCVDLDTAEGTPEPFFDGGPDQIRAHLDGETIRRLYRAQVAFQVECLVLDAGGDLADRLLGVDPEAETLSPQVVAAEFPAELSFYFGQPAYTLTSAQIMLWLSLKAKYRRRFGPAV
jgi:hypothetical protein